MDVIHQILGTYAQFFDFEMWGEVLTDPVSWGLIGSLILIEGLLSSDNALVLAIVVKPLPKNQRKKALLYGLFGAYFFRFIFIGIGVYLVKFWFIKILGAAYLAWIVIKHFRGEDDEDENKNYRKRSRLARLIGDFWSTVCTVELLDLSFSVDSILAAFAVSNKVWILFMGGALGILMMRTVAGLFITLIEKIPELENTAFVLIAIISLKMVASVFGYELPPVAFFAILIIAFLITFIVHFVHSKKMVKEEVATTRED